MSPKLSLPAKLVVTSEGNSSFRLQMIPRYMYRSLIMSQSLKSSNQAAILPPDKILEVNTYRYHISVLHGQFQIGGPPIYFGLPPT